MVGQQKVQPRPPSRKLVQKPDKDLSLPLPQQQEVVPTAEETDPTVQSAKEPLASPELQPEQQPQITEQTSDPVQEPAAQQPVATGGISQATLDEKFVLSHIFNSQSL